MDDGQEIVGGLGAARTEHCNIAGAVAGSDYCHHVPLGIPQATIAIGVGLAVLGIDVLIGRDGVLSSCQRAFLPSEVAGPCFAGEPGVQDIQSPVLFPADQDFTCLADGQPAQGLVVDVLLGENVLIHTVDGIANHFPGGVRRNLELYRILLIVEEAIRAFQFYDLIPAQGQFFGGLHATLAVGVEYIGFFGRITTAGIDHGQAFLCAVLVNHIDGERGIGQLDSLAGLGVHLDQLQVALHLLIQDVVGHIAVTRLCYTTTRLAEDALGRVAVHRKAKGITLEHVLGNGGLNDKVLAIGQAGHPEYALLIGEKLA